MLPNIFNLTDDYHIKCYRKCIALPSSLQNQIDSYFNISTSLSFISKINIRSYQATKLIEDNALIFKSIFCEKTHKNIMDRLNICICVKRNIIILFKNKHNIFNQVQNMIMK